jgi:hypothetical protein
LCIPFLRNDWRQRYVLVVFKPGFFPSSFWDSKRILFLGVDLPDSGVTWLFIIVAINPYVVVHAGVEFV